MSDAAPPCPTCSDAGDVREYGSGHTCDECGVIFHHGGIATTVYGPRPGFTREGDT